MLCRVAIERSKVRAEQGDVNEPMPLYHSVHDLITELHAKHDFLAEYEIAPPDPAKEEQVLKDLKMLAHLTSNDQDFAKHGGRKNGLKLVTKLAETYV